MSLPPGSFADLNALDAASADAGAAPDATQQTLPPEFVSATQPPDVSFATLKVLPPSPLYVTIDDVLALSVTNSVADLSLTISYRMLRADGTVIVTKHVFSPASDRSPTGDHLSLPEGWLLGVCVQVSAGNLTRGQCYVTVGVQRPDQAGIQRQLQLCSDYLSTRYILGWPGGMNRDSAEGEGAPLSYTPAAPAVGAEILQLAPANTRWHLHAVRFRLTTSAAVPTRQIQFVIRGGGGEGLYLVNSPASQAPSTSMTYMVSTVGFAPTAFAALTMLPMPPRMPLPLNASWGTATGNLDVADQYDQIGYLAEELFD
jgi:hypothetical protein